jgi:hypothetical protein
MNKMLLFKVSRLKAFPIFKDTAKWGNLLELSWPVESEREIKRGKFTL